MIGKVDEDTRPGRNGETLVQFRHPDHFLFKTSP